MTREEYLELDKARRLHSDAVTELNKLVKFHTDQRIASAEAIDDGRTTCEHDWKYLYTGRHGSDKGDKYYECRVCDSRRRE